MNVELNDYDAVLVNLVGGSKKFVILMDSARDPILADIASELVKFNNRMIFDHTRYIATNGVKKTMNCYGDWIAEIYAERDYR